jgi:hypothetical protein
MIEVILWGILYFLHHFSIRGWNTSIPNVAEKERPNQASYRGESGLIIVNITHVKANIERLDQRLPYSTMIYESMPIIVARTTDTSHQTRVP